MVARGGVRGCWGCAWLPGGAWLLGVCMVAGGHAWLPGGVHGCGECVVVGGHGGGCVGYDEIRSMSGRYASYWNAFLFLLHSCGREHELRCKEKNRIYGTASFIRSEIRLCVVDLEL